MKTGYLSAILMVLTFSGHLSADKKAKDPKKMESVKPAAEAKPAEPAAKALDATLLKEFKAVQSQLAQENIFSVDFRQEVYRDLRKKTSVNSGTAYFQRPKSFRWIITSPQKSEWIFDGHELFFDDLEKKQGTRFKADTAQGRELRQIVDLIVDFSGVDVAYEMSELNKKDKIMTFVLKPKKKANFEKLEAELDMAMAYLKKLKLYFDGNNTSTFIFSNFTKHKVSPVTFAPFATIKIHDATN